MGYIQQCSFINGHRQRRIRRIRSFFQSLDFSSSFFLALCPFGLNLSTKIFDAFSKPPKISCVAVLHVQQYSEKSNMPIQRSAEPTHLSPRLIVQLLGVHISTVLGWIERRELLASNISSSRSRPRWRIAKSDLEEFLASRSNRAEGV